MIEVRPIRREEAEEFLRPGACQGADDEERLDLLARFFRAGKEARERLVYVSESMTVDVRVERLTPDQTRMLELSQRAR